MNIFFALPQNREKPPGRLRNRRFPRDGSPAATINTKIFHGSRWLAARRPRQSP
jgi:hypothetical protein